MNVDSDISVKATEVQVALALLQAELGLSDSQADAVASWVRFHYDFHYEIHYVLGFIDVTWTFLSKERWAGLERISEPTAERGRCITLGPTKSPFRQKPNWNRKRSRYGNDCIKNNIFNMMLGGVCLPFVSSGVFIGWSGPPRRFFKRIWPCTNRRRACLLGAKHWGLVARIGTPNPSGTICFLYGISLCNYVGRHVTAVAFVLGWH